MNICIVDDHMINRKVIREKLMPHIDINIVFESDNGQNFLNKISEMPLEELPDIVLMDIGMPELDGISTISIAKIKYPDMKFIVLTIYEDNDKIFEAIKAGASGYLLKEDDAVNIVDALENVLVHNGIPLSPSIARRAMNLLCGNDNVKTSTAKNEKSYNLSEREMDVLKHLVRGESYQLIAGDLCISPNTVRTHVNNIYKKLHLNSKGQIMRLAYQNNWI